MKAIVIERSCPCCRVNRGAARRILCRSTKSPLFYSAIDSPSKGEVGAESGRFAIADGVLTIYNF